jgi:alpha-L-fucosidase
VSGIALLLGASACAFAQQAGNEDAVWEQAVKDYAAPRARYVQQADGLAKAGPFQPNWQSLKNYQVPQWFNDAKFGIFIHWGLYSVPAYSSEWYSRKMYLKNWKEYKHQVETYGPETKFGYKDFIPMFQPKKFDPQAWAKLFKESGAKYVIPVAEHHDGFPMYDSELTQWCAGKMGPKRDLIADLATAIRAEGLHFGASSHRAEHYFFLNGGREFPSDVQDPKYASFYGPAHAKIDPHKGKGHPGQPFLDDWLARSAEIVTKYQPELFYFDWWVEMDEFQPYLQRFASFYYNQGAKRNQQVVLFRKNDAFPNGTTVLDIERGALDQIRPVAWQTDTSVSWKSWGYVEGDRYKSPESIVWQLVDIVSKNGNLLLNIGPKADGTIPPEAESILRSIGKWLDVNGEAIYGSRPWTKYGEGPTKMRPGTGHEKTMEHYTAQDIRFTTKDGNIFAISLGWPENGRIAVRSLGDASGFRVGSVALLGSNAEIQWKQGSKGLELTVPKQPSGMYAYTFRIGPAK